MAQRQGWRRAMFGLMSALAILMACPGPIGAAPRAAPPPAVPQSYADCAEQVVADATRALVTAEAWWAKGGGDDAEHCRADALVALSRPAEAAPLYEQLAITAQRLPEQADLYALSAAAWRLADQPEQALHAVDRALKIHPEDPALLTDRAEANAALGRFADAIEDLSHALDLDPGNVDALVFRASAFRQTDALIQAAADLKRALALAPGNVEALLERGIVRRLRGDKTGARVDWSAVIATAPDSPAATSARANLARLDAEASP